MLQLLTLSSGSKGNATIIASPSTCIVLDMGLSMAELSKRLSCSKHGDLQCDGVLISHSHNDHIKGIAQFSNLYDCKVYASEAAWEEIDYKLQIPINKQRMFDTAFAIGDIDIYPFSTPHDATDSKGFCFVHGNSKIAFATDLGHMTRNIFSHLDGSNLVVLESNYDTDMLINGSYPQYLKTRILGENGHLSNDDAAVCAVELAKRGLKNLILAHISENNNTMQLALKQTLDTLKTQSISPNDIRVTVAPQRNCGILFEV